MARPIIARRLEKNNKEAFQEVHRQILFSLRSRLTNLILSVEIVSRIATRRLDSYFVSDDDYECFMGRLGVLQDYTKQMFEFSRSFDAPLFLEPYAPYTEAKWDEFYLDLVHGLKRRIVIIRHLIACYTVPDLALPVLAHTTRLPRMVKEIEDFPTTISHNLARIEEFLDEDSLEAYFIKDIEPY